MAFVSPLRYPGGKGRLGHWLREVIASNNLRDCPYIEPFAGGAGAAVFLLTHGCVSRIHINDLDPLVSTFWSVVATHPARLAAMVRSAEVTLPARERAKEVVRNLTNAAPLELAFSVFLLNRTSRSGILSGGPIGGREQSGRYKVDARFNREGLANRIEQIGSLANRITVTQADAADLLSDIGRRKKQLVYCDPPYYVKGHQLYKSHYADADHAQIAKSVSRLKCPWLVTYDPHPRIDDLYAEHSKLTFNLHYSTHLGRPKAEERLFYSSLTLPREPYLHR